MKKTIRLLAAVGLLASTVGCGLQAPVVPPLAAIYTDVKAPLDVDFLRTRVQPKRGEASTVTILGIVSLGDASSNAAAMQGGLETIESADYRYFNILGVYQSYTTIVHGK